ncbi:MAG: hypothetical protein ACOX78_10290 [Lachnospiraceae bacterium]|jgi:hypothetical protein
MAEKNILNGSIEDLDKIIAEIKEYQSGVSREEQVRREISDLEEKISETEKTVEDEINTKVKDGESAVKMGFERSISTEKAKLKDVTDAREKSKQAGVKDRIKNETEYLKNENADLRKQRKDSFAENGIPSYADSTFFYVLCYAKGIGPKFLYAIILLVVFLVIPVGVLYLLPQQLSVLDISPLVPLLYDAVMAIAFFTIIRSVRTETILTHLDIIKSARQMKKQIRMNKKKMKQITRGIKNDTDEGVYGLEEFDKKIAEINGEIESIRDNEKKALDDFEKNTKPDIISEIEGRHQKKTDSLKSTLDQRKKTSSDLEERLKQQRLYISTNYEPYLGPDFSDLSKLEELRKVMTDNKLTTIAEAMDMARKK